MPNKNELVAYNRTPEEVAAVLGADGVVYQDIDALVASVTKFNPNITNLDLSCFNGKYVTGDIDELYFDANQGQAQNRQIHDGQCSWPSVQTQPNTNALPCFHTQTRLSRWSKYRTTLKPGTAAS
jgi:amidophosphoribosyltransferase